MFHPVRWAVRSEPILFAAIVAAVILSGCSNGGLPGFGAAAQKCDSVAVPELYQGDRFVYAMEGDFITPASGPVLIDFREVDPQRAPSHPGLFVFTEGSRLKVTVAEGSQPRLSASGEVVDALQVAYETHPAGYADGVHALDEWLSPDGWMVQSHSRLLDHSREAGKPLHGIQTTGIGGPALMAAHLFAGQVLERDWTTNVTIPPRELPGQGPTSPGYYAASVTALKASPCRALVALRIQWPDPGEDSQVGGYLGYRVDLEFGADAPAPGRYATNWTGPTNSEPLGMRLLGFERGDARTLPSLRSQTAPVAAFPPAPLESGFPKDETCRYGTCLHDALEALRMHPQVAAWFQLHPAAAPLAFAHRVGEPGGPYVDEWAFEWADDTERLAAVHRAVRPEALADDPGAASGVTTVQTKESMDFPRATDVAIGLDGLASIQENTFGDAPEVMACDYRLLVCYLSTHEISGVPRVNTAGDLPRFISDGIMVSMASGLVIQVNIRGDDLLAPTP